MDKTSNYDDITIPEAYDLLERFKNAHDISYNPPTPTYSYVPNNEISYEKFKACIDKIKWNRIIIDNGIPYR